MERNSDGTDVPVSPLPASYQPLLRILVILTVERTGSRTSMMKEKSNDINLQL